MRFGSGRSSAGERNIIAYRQRIRTSQLLLQTIRISLGNARLVGVVEADNAAKAQEGSDEHSQMEETFAGGDVGILFRAEDTENLVVLVNWLAKVALLLLIPPAAIWVSELALHLGRVLVAAILSHS